MIPFPELLSDPSPAIGTFIQSASPEFLEASAYAGFRFAAIDLEHASFGTETLVHLIRAGEAAGLSMLARVPGLDAALIKKSLDMGAAGIIVPNIDTPEQAAEALEAGASLIEVRDGLVRQGPQFVSKIQKYLLNLVKNERSNPREDSPAPEA